MQAGRAAGEIELAHESLRKMVLDLENLDATLLMFDLQRRSSCSALRQSVSATSLSGSMKQLKDLLACFTYGLPFFAFVFALRALDRLMAFN